VLQLTIVVVQAHKAARQSAYYLSLLHRVRLPAPPQYVQALQDLPIQFQPFPALQVIHGQSQQDGLLQQDKVPIP
jgi:hypothetical protein